MYTYNGKYEINLHEQVFIVLHAQNIKPSVVCF